MLQSKIAKNGIAISMSLIMSNMPSLAFAEAEMIPTHEVVQSLTRAETVAAVEGYLSREDVQVELIRRGLSPQEVSSRLATLSEAEMRQLSSQVAQAQAGGNILITVILVLLIVFLVQRI